MNKKGFTLTELLAVIVVLAIIIGIATTSVLGVLNRANKKTMEEMTDNLKDAAITCYLDTKDVSQCNTSDILKSSGYFDDDRCYCKGLNISFNLDGDDYVAIVHGKCSKDHIDECDVGD